MTQDTKPEEKQEQVEPNYFTIGKTILGNGDVLAPGPVFQNQDTDNEGECNNE